MADAGASGTPATDGVKTEQTNGTAAGVTGGMDAVAIQEEYRRAFNDIEAIMQRIEARLSFHEDVSGLRDHLNGAREWVADKLGLDKRDDGTFQAPGGTGADPNTVGQTTTPSDAKSNDTKDSSGSSTDSTSK